MQILHMDEQSVLGNGLLHQYQMASSCFTFYLRSIFRWIAILTGKSSTVMKMVAKYVVNENIIPCVYDTILF